MKHRPSGKAAGKYLFAKLMAIFMGDSTVNIFPHTKISKPEKRYRRSNNNPHQGEREKARRRAQLAKGMHREYKVVK